MAVQGVFASDQGIQGGRMGDFASGLLQTMPTGSAPMLALSSGMNSADASDTVITWFEENHMSGRTRITNNAGVGTLFTVENASEYVQGVVALVESTGEMVFVEAIAGNDITVTRDLNGVGAAAVDGSVTPEGLQRIGNAREEGSDRPVAITNVGFPRLNYMQIFRNTWDVTQTARAINYRTGDIAAKSKADAAILHAEDIERSILFGIKTTGTLNGKPFHTMDGIINMLSTNIYSQTTNTTWNNLDTFLQAVFSYNIKGKPNERIAFGGNTVLSVMNQIARLDSQLNISVGEGAFGLKIFRWISPYGDIILQTHPMFNENPVWTQNLLVLHPGAVRTRYLRRTSEDPNDKAGSRNGVDADFGVITTEMSVEYKAEATGGYYTGIDTAA
jgi:hypothetical protein